MSCHPTSEKQKDFANDLVQYLYENNHKSATKYGKKVKACNCIKEMSGLIDKLLGLRKEVQDASVN